MGAVVVGDLLEVVVLQGEKQGQQVGGRDLEYGEQVSLLLNICSTVSSCIKYFENNFNEDEGKNSVQVLGKVSLEQELKETIRFVFSLFDQQRYLREACQKKVLNSGHWPK